MRIQSYIDVITNSSTTVFTFANNIEGVKSVINAILKTAGSRYTCDDLFDISSDYDISITDAVDDYYLDKAKEHLELKEIVNQYIEECNKKNWKEIDLDLIEKLALDIYNFLMKHKEEWNIMSLNEYAKDYNDNWCHESKYISYYNITPKNPSHSDVIPDIKLINHLFDYDATYC